MKCPVRFCQSNKLDAKHLVCAYHWSKIHIDDVLRLGKLRKSNLRNEYDELADDLIAWLGAQVDSKLDGKKRNK